MKKLMMTAAAIAMSATSSFAIGVGDVDHLVDNPFADSTWAEVFFVAYADEQGGKIFYDEESVVHYLEGEIETAELTRELQYEELPLWEAGSDDYLNVVKTIHGLNGKILGAGKLLTAIADVNDTSAIDAANDTIDHLNKQSVWLTEQVVDLNGQLATIAADTTAEVTAEFEGIVSGLEADVATAAEVNVELKSELFAAQQANTVLSQTGSANGELLAQELTTITELAETHYEGRVAAEKDLDVANNTINSLEETHAAAVDAIADYNTKDAARYENDPAAHMHAIYGYVLQLRKQLGLD